MHTETRCCLPRENPAPAAKRFCPSREDVLAREKCRGQQNGLEHVAENLDLLEVGSIIHLRVSPASDGDRGNDNDESPSSLSNATAPAKKKPKTAAPQSPTSKQEKDDNDSSSSSFGKTDLIAPWIRLLQHRPTQNDPPEQMMEWLDQVYRVSESYWKNSSNDNNRIPPVMALSADSESKVDESLTSSSSENGREGGNNKATSSSSSSDSDSGRD